MTTDGNDERGGAAPDGREDRRRFLAAIGASGAAGLAGCGGLFGGNGGSGSGDGNGGGTGTGGNGGGDDGAGGTGSGDGTGGNGGGSGETTTVRNGDPGPPTDSEVVPEDRRSFALPADRGSVTYEAEYSENTAVIEGEAMDAVVEADTDAHRYTFDADALDVTLAEGTTLLLSGVALRTITGVERSGSEVTVETEPAALTDAIENGRVGWDAEVGFDPAFAPDTDARGPPTTPDGDGQSSLGHLDAAGGSMVFEGIEMVHADGRSEVVPAGDVVVTQTGFKWTYTQGNKEFVFQLTMLSQEEVEVVVQVSAPADAEANVAMTATGTVGTAQSIGDAQVSGGSLQALELRQDQLAAELEVEIAAAGAGTFPIDWQLPGLFFQYTLFAGPVPITVGIEARLIGNVRVPAEASATAKSSFSYAGGSKIAYDGSSVDVDATMGTQQLDPEPADSAANIGNAVDLQFGVAFPRFEISVFDQLLIPYVQMGPVIGSRLTWGPLCKSSYVRFVVQAGYDFKVFGVTLSSDKTTLYEDKQTAYSENCEQSGS